MKWDEVKNRLLCKAAEDEAAMTILMAATKAPDDTIGFHAQQPVEKLLKALLCHRHMDYQRTHDLAALLDALADSGLAVPAEVERCRFLQPYAVELRYDDIPVGQRVPLDRTELQRDVGAVRQWVERMIS